MRNLFIAVLAILSVSRNDAAQIQDLKDLHISNDISPVDSDSDVPASIDEVVYIDESLDIFGDEQSLGVDRAVTRSNLYEGSINFGDRSLHRTYYIRDGAPNTIRSLTIHYRGASSTRISAVIVTEQPTFEVATQNPSAAITGGRLGTNEVSVTMTSQVGRGFYYLLEIWGQ